MRNQPGETTSNLPEKTRQARLPPLPPPSPPPPPPSQGEGPESRSDKRPGPRGGSEQWLFLCVPVLGGSDVKMTRRAMGGGGVGGVSASGRGWR